MTIRELVLLGAMFLPTAEATAVCLGGRHPTAQEEFRSSVAVMLGRVSSHKDLMEDTTDPRGITATVYRIDVLRHFKGAVGRTIQLRSENTSSRFPMREGEDYLLFLNKDGKTYSVDSCGNSTQAESAANVISEFRAKK